MPSKDYGIAAVGRPAIFIGDPDGEIGRALRAIGTGLVVAEGDSVALARVIGRTTDEAGIAATYRWF